MGENVNKLPFANIEKLNPFLHCLDKTNKEQNLIKSVTSTSERLELLESCDKMKKSIKNNSTLAANNKMNFMNKKENIQI